MSKNEEQILAKLNSLRNCYSNNEDFIAAMDTWPKTIRKLIYRSEKLMLRFELIELIPDPIEDENVFIGME